ncbi:hypothetical protein IWQ60_008072 [Tieghemiomyces parasiticus]|uniref:Superoxide dismutase copper/zinc binding domain-containing protein n=1 Tax=Tieghemiomyces parasiticus TaxID=78921 RepID=A0A9W7ZY41_9FUNG|nr:hypothetical protein IWQ60_008072 [Tieghemiomyces parasiticus]
MLPKIILAALAAVAGTQIVSAHWISEAKMSCPSGKEGTFKFDDPHHGYVEVTITFKNLIPGAQYNYFIDQHSVGAIKDCTKSGGLFDPKGVFSNPDTYSCKADKIKTCAVGDLTGRGGVLVGTNDPSRVTTLVWKDRGIVLRGTNSVNGKSVVLYDNNENLILCSDIVRVQ